MADRHTVVHVEMPAKDGKRARKFYTSLLNWEFKDAGVQDMDYFMTEGAEPVVAIWTEPGKKGPIVYFDTPDIDAAIRKTRELGGKADEKMPVPGQGWFSACTDTEGNEFSLWQRDPAAPVYEPQQTEATARS
jgi:predicted enzyme related to lactoylglutathione lyase